ncbi:unnamed protein product [Rhizophagus irregularis]|nr:unnamed protein product [Rhizophagus irregularis]
MDFLGYVSLGGKAGDLLVEKSVARIATRIYGRQTRWRYWLISMNSMQYSKKKKKFTRIQISRCLIAI